MLKKLIAVALVLILVLSLAPFAFAADEEPENAVAYNTSTGVYYDTLEDALNNAKNRQTVVLIHDYTLKESISIGLLKSVYIASQDGYTGDTVTGSNNQGSALPSNKNDIKAAVTLTVPEISYWRLWGNQSNWKPICKLRVIICSWQYFWHWENSGRIWGKNLSKI